MSDIPAFDVREQAARIDRLPAGSSTLALGRLRLDAERLKPESERIELEAERIEFGSESGKLDHDRVLAPFALADATLGAGAALFAAAQAFVRAHGG